MTVSNQFEVLGTLEDPGELWDTFKRETLSAAEQCIGARLGVRGAFVLQETLDLVEESRAARLAGDRGQHRTLSRRARASLRRDKERYVRGIVEEVEGNLAIGDLEPSY